MKKHLAVFKTSLQNSFTYPAEIVVWMFVEFMPILMLSFVWLDVFESQALVGGFNKEQLITYYIAALIIGRFVSWYIHHQIAREIRYGKMSTLLIKPYPYLIYHAISNSAWRLLRFIILTPFLGVLVLNFHHSLYINTSLISLFLMFLALILAFFIFLSISLLLGTIGFWFQKVEGIYNLYWVLRNIFSGKLIPITLLPPSFLLMSKILPFRYGFSFPLEIYFNQVAGNEMWLGFLWGIFWLFINYLLIKVFWKAGLKRYSSVGG